MICGASITTLPPSAPHLLDLALPAAHMLSMSSPELPHVSTPFSMQSQPVPEKAELEACRLNPFENFPIAMEVTE